jgi:small subunit ribosomal protein S20
MPITTSAKKALRGSQKKRAFNMRKKDALTKTVKQVKKLIANKQVKEALAMMPQVQKIIDKATKTGYLKKNTAARKKSRISAMIKKAK